VHSVSLSVYVPRFMLPWLWILLNVYPILAPFTNLWCPEENEGFWPLSPTCPHASKWNPLAACYQHDIHITLL